MKGRPEPKKCASCGAFAEYRALVERSELKFFKDYCGDCSAAAVRSDCPPYELVELDQAANRRRRQTAKQRKLEHQQRLTDQATFFGTEVGK